MAEAYIYDAVRTPRGKGKKDGKLHEITPIQLGTQVLQAVRDRTGIDTHDVDDVIFGCVAPVGEQGSDIARVAVLNADYAETTAGVQINRFCASGLEAVNMAAAKVMTGEALFAIGGGVESMSRVPMGADGGAWAMDPAVAYKTYFAPQGIGADLIATKYGFSRNDVDAYAMESQKRAARAWAEGRFKNSVIGVKDVIGEIVLDHDEHMRPQTDMQSLGSLAPAFATMGEQIRQLQGATSRHPKSPAKPTTNDFITLADAVFCRQPVRAQVQQQHRRFLRRAPAISARPFKIC